MGRCGWGYTGFDLIAAYTSTIINSKNNAQNFMKFVRYFDIGMYRWNLFAIDIVCMPIYVSVRGKFVSIYCKVSVCQITKKNDFIWPHKHKFVGKKAQI